jgi:hypothetical protein
MIERGKAGCQAKNLRSCIKLTAISQRYAPCLDLHAEMEGNFEPIPLRIDIQRVLKDRPAPTDGQRLHV